MQNYKDASIGIFRVTINDDSTEYEWIRTLSKGINYLWKICHLNQIQEHTLFYQSCRFNLHLKDMKNWMHTFVEDEKRNEYLVIALVIKIFCENLQQIPYVSDVYQQSIELEGMEEIWELIEKVTRESCHVVGGIVSHKLLCAEGYFISKVVSKKQRNTWDPGKLQTMQQDSRGRKRCSRMSGQQHNRILDPGGFK